MWASIFKEVKKENMLSHGPNVALVSFLNVTHKHLKKK